MINGLPDSQARKSEILKHQKFKSILVQDDSTIFDALELCDSKKKLQGIGYGQCK